MKKGKKWVTSNNSKISTSPKLFKKDIFFKIAIVHKLDNGFDFKSLTIEGIKEFHNFINEILNKKMTISQVENLYMRKTSNPFNNRTVDQQIEIREIHLGKNRQPFRLFGYFNDDNYFVLTKIDPNHNFHE
ncbi:MAG6450 family protein [Mycoplasma mycoides]|uniref:MAG6450 family protein n=1 Tax=Mycoplasma mycoides TaxID=2102 RepID=UPI0010185ED2|nr:hypothetical protein [Mycoplasma mycoides]SRX64188.1 hypothetical protein MMC68H_00448 [Mycoplasma mycoides subsp. capri]